MKEPTEAGIRTVLGKLYDSDEINWGWHRKHTGRSMADSCWYLAENNKIL